MIELTPAMQSVFYRINKDDVIVFTSNAWDSFALVNDAPDITADKVLHHSLWEFIKGDTISQLYREIIAQARAGNILRFNFRCDSPDKKRSMEMIVSPEEDGSVQFQTYVLEAEERLPQKLLDRSVERAGELISICSWCKSIYAESHGWISLDKAITSMGLFDQTELPELTHGMCEDCFKIISEKMNRRKNQG